MSLQVLGKNGKPYINSDDKLLKKSGGGSSEPEECILGITTNADSGDYAILYPYTEPSKSGTVFSSTFYAEQGTAGSTEVSCYTNFPIKLYASDRTITLQSGENICVLANDSIEPDIMYVVPMEATASITVSIS